MPIPRSESGKSHYSVLTIIALVFGLLFGGSVHADKMSATPQSRGIYRLPFADGTHIKVFWDFTTHRPAGRVDLLAIGGSGSHRVVAAAGGRVVAIEDGFSKRQAGGPGVVCHQNYVWIVHSNGEWTNYSHLAPWLGDEEGSSESGRPRQGRPISWRRGRSGLRHAQTSAF